MEPPLTVTTTSREGRLIDATIERFGLQLSGLHVYTEAATGPYRWNPILAARAGARVACVTRDSRWGTADVVRRQTLEAAKAAGVMDRIEVHIGHDQAALGRADIVTNSGFVRPIDDALLAALPDRASISLMYEPWEIRRSDIDLAACRRRGIPVAGTDEHHPLLRIHQVNPFVAIKAMTDAGSAVYNDRILVVSSGPTGDAIAQAFHALGLDFARVAPSGKPAPRCRHGLLDQATVRNELGSFDVIVLWDHVVRTPLVGDGRLVDMDRIRAAGTHPIVVPICGLIDEVAVRAAGCTIHPAPAAVAGVQVFSAGDLGMRPVLELFAAGLKVGERMARARHGGADAAAAVRAALREAPALALEGAE